MDEDQTRERDSRVGHASSSSSSSSACVLVKVVVLHTPHPPPSVGNSPFCQALCWTTCSQQHSTPPPLSCSISHTHASYCSPNSTPCLFLFPLQGSSHATIRRCKARHFVEGEAKSFLWISNICQANLSNVKLLFTLPRKYQRIKNDIRK